MKKIITFFSVFIFALTFSNISYSQSDEEMQAWMSYMSPGAMHEQLAKCSGNWTFTSTFWMDPNGEPMVSEGTMSAEMIYGGRYLIMKFKGSMWGMPFEGMSLEGFDNASKTFNSVWIDNLGTGMMYSTGTMNDDKTKINYTGSMVDPMTGESMTVRQVASFSEDGSMTFEMYGTHEGTEYRSMLIEFSR